ncbi:MAG: S4 domain-containing protein [Bacteroidales bacterium]|jgi:ribosome-associated heat shock protein Hsp15|nr:S4 domain-containing protein [Bacteroidales bacterium]MDD2617433.1 S4 domain-containing protein [Bacteroidales bacterium]MDD4640333.1 S4 domain-containing protein [Bacteroidales bacterium]NLB03743.1 RNA-binding S4 domain-containing protein [Bacteroidales bacterium]
MGNSVRIDKWLWSARIYKTRTLAGEACRKGQVSIAGLKVKPSRMVTEGEILSVRKNSLSLTLKILSPIQNRVAARLIPEVLQDLTPAEEYEMMEMARIASFGNRSAGSGRPTKKERRDLENFLDVEED